LAVLVTDDFAKMRTLSRFGRKVVWMEITDEGRNAMRSDRCCRPTERPGLVVASRNRSSRRTLFEVADALPPFPSLLASVAESPRQ
jgi:hypothetical protein